jgi:hypothetical protein
MSKVIVFGAENTFISRDIRVVAEWAKMGEADFHLGDEFTPDVGWAVDIDCP